jgi:hypothetical protein
MIQEFLRDKSRDHLVMLAAIVLLFVSQFFDYGDGNSAYPIFGPDFAMDVWINFGLNGIGWELHPQAWVIIVVLAFAFLRSDIYEHPLMQKFGWWAGFVLVIACNTPSDGIRAFGSTLGLIAILLALVAAIMHQMAQRKAKA